MLYLVVVTPLVLISTTSVAFAYLDPGTGSIVLQALVAGIVTAWAAFKMFWWRIKSYFGRGNDGQKDNPDSTK